MSVAWFFNQYDQTHGAPRLTVVLARNGVHVGKKTVAASLRCQGLRAVSSCMFRHPRSKDVGECVYEDSCNR
ncbi:transposase [Mobiluncus mulieris]|uniref:Transposase n=2 Tax=Mobiluncus mulieris TaxID=2052 RepID=A0A7Y0YIM0_9ACTO|nr:transposase [Mobiluncus mulieris]NMX12488.1 transposase [Mobiluncus mulieris]